MKLIQLTVSFCFLVLFSLISHKAAAQLEIGIKASPSITSIRTIAQDKYNLEGDGSSVGFGFGVIGDYFFGANYAFSTGLLYNIKGGTVSYNYSQHNPNDPAVPAPIRGKDDISLHYLEIPLTIKLFTNEVAPDVKLYFQAGGSLNTMLGSRVGDKKVDDNGDKFTKRFNLFELGGLLGAGAEWQLGQSTKMFGGISYHRGLTDIDNHYENVLGDKKIELKNNAFSLDLGLKF